MNHLIKNTFFIFFLSLSTALAAEKSTITLANNRQDDNEVCERNINLNVTDIIVNYSEGQLNIEIDTDGADLNALFETGDEFTINYNWGRDIERISYDCSDAPFESCSYCVMNSTDASYDIPVTYTSRSTVVSVSASSLIVTDQSMFDDLKHYVARKTTASEPGIREYGNGETRIYYTCQWIEDFKYFDFAKSHINHAYISSAPVKADPIITIVGETRTYCGIQYHLELENAGDFLGECGEFKFTRLDYIIRYPDTTTPITTNSIINPGYRKYSDTSGQIGGRYFYKFRTGIDFEIVADLTYECFNCEQSKTITISETVVQTPVTISVIEEDQNTCTVNFDYTQVFGEEGCIVKGQTWELDGVPVSNLKAPIFELTTGSYEIDLTLNYKCPSCRGDLMGFSETYSLIYTIPQNLASQITLSDQTIEKPEVLQTNAVTFSSNWPIHATENTGDFKTMHPYAKGEAGVWRPSSNLVYNNGAEVRTGLSGNLANSGVFEANEFKWQSPIADEIKEWLPANVIEAYNTSGQEIENRDVLNTYSSAHYGYGGNYPMAVANNIAKTEFAYTGFEDLTGGSVSGNFIFGSSAVYTSETYKIESGRSNMLILDELEGDVNYLKDERVTVMNDHHVAEVGVYCTGTDDDFPNKTVMVLDERISESTDVFYGGKLVYGKIVYGTLGTIEDNWGHSGDKSLKITNTFQGFNQQLLRLESGRTYEVSAWASAQKDKVSYPNPFIADNLQIVFRLDNVVVGSAQLEGPVVEGWQMVKGTFTVPESGDNLLKLSFGRGSASIAYFDDLRVYPIDGNMQSYVYDHQYRLSATLDENNFATFYDYDGEGNLFLVRKETVRGIKTIQQSSSNQKRSE